MPDVKTKLVRGGTSGINNTPLKDGQILFDQDLPRIYIDAYKNNVLTRVQMTKNSSGGGDAEDIAYNNTASELEAEDVQAAIDEVVTILDDKADAANLGTASALDVAESGDASTSEVVKGDDSRLSNARNAADVYPWAKAETKPTYTASEVGLGNVGNFKAVSTEENQGLTTTEQANARANIGAGTSSFDGDYDSLTGKPTLGTAAEKNVATSGDAGSTEVVMGNDSRLTDSRNAADVYSWAKAANKPSYTASEVGAYTKSEVDNKISTLETNIDWKEAVATYDDIATTYPNPVDGWTVNVKDTDYTYRYNGSAWVAISANAIPQATASVDGLMTTTQVTKLNGIATGAEVNVQADWNVTDTSSDAFIKNKPTIPAAQVQSNWTQTTSTAVDYIKNKPTLGTAAAKDVASSGNASTSQVVMGNDTRLSDARNAADVSAWAKASTKPSYTASEVGLGNVGNYKAVSTVASQGLTDTEKSNARANIGAGTSSFSGNYNDLSNKPTIPTVNNATLTIQKNGSNVQTFTANASSNVTANITVPTKTSDLTNDSGYTTFPMAAKTLDANYKTKFRTETKGNTSNGEYISTIRTDTSGIDSLPQYGSGLASGKGDTHMYLYTNYNTDGFYVGGGNDDKLNWVSRVYTSNNKPSKSDVGLGNVGNFLAVSTVASQGLTDTQKSNARANIGAGTSNFSGSYNDLTNKPTIPTKVSQLTNDSGYTTNTGTITSVKMNGTTVSSSGEANLGTVITAHQDISGKADKSSTVSNVAWDSTNKKLTKTINGTTSDVVTGATILGGLTKSQVTTALGYTPPTSDTNTTYAAGTGVTITGTNNAINVTYGSTANTACQGNDSRLSDARTPTAHNQASNTITTMTGYSKPSSTSAISTSDSLNTAIGKLEKAIDGKGSGTVTGSGTSGYIAKFNGTSSITNGPAFGSSNTTFLRNDGTWNAPPVTSVSLGDTGTASKTAVNYQRVGVNGSYVTVRGTMYMEQSITLSTSADTTATFTNSNITTSSAVDVYTSVASLRYKTMNIASGSCTVTFDKQSSASTISVRIYIK